MSKKDYVPVGGILTRTSGKKYEVVLMSDYCTGCAFRSKHMGWCAGVMCTPVSREDNNEVIFIRRKDLETV